MRIAPPREPSWQLSPDEVTIVKNSIAKGASDEELKFCLTVARRYRLDPFKQQIWFVKRWDKSADNGQGGKGMFVWTPQVGINGLLFAAARDHKAEFGSVSLPEFGPMVEMEGKLKAPEWARVKVWKKGEGQPTEAEAWWSEYAPYELDKAPFWRKMPRRMLGKCATALAIRQAYPDLGGLYIPEECENIQQDFTESGRQIVDQAGFAPSGRAVTWEAQQQGSHEAAQAVAKRIIEQRGKPAEPAKPSEIAAVDDSRPVIELDWTDEASPIVRGDIGNVLELIQNHCTAKWEGDWWHIQPRDAETVRDMAAQLGFRVREVMPKKPSAEVAMPPADKAAGSRRGVAKDGDSAAPAVVKGVIQHFTEKMTKGGPKRPSQPYLNVLLKTENGDRWYSAFDRDLFEFISKAKGKEGEFFVSKNGDFYNIQGIKKLAGREFVDGKVPVVQRDREPGKTLFGG